MRQRSRLVLGSLVGAAAIHLVFLACGGPRREPDDAASGDSGGVLDALADAMQTVTDGETRDVHAQSMPMQANCEPVRGASGGGTYYYATFMVPGFEPQTAPEVSARVCGLACTGASCGYTGSTFGVTGAACRSSDGVYMRPGRIDVYCGAEGDRGQSARIWVH